MNQVFRKGTDHDEVKPWNWATLPLREQPVEIVSYPCPVTGTVFVRMTPGDPTTLREIPLKYIAAFKPSRYLGVQTKETNTRHTLTVFSNSLRVSSTQHATRIDAETHSKSWLSLAPHLIAVIKLAHIQDCA